MTSTRKARSGPDKQASRRRKERQLAAAPLLHGRPPFEGYREWLVPSPATGRFELNADAPPDTRAYFARLEDLLLQLYGGRIPLAATYVDDRIAEGTIPLAASGMVRSVPVQELAALLTNRRGQADTPNHLDVCPRLNCVDGQHEQAEHIVWKHLHHLHAAGLLLLDDHDVLHLAQPPRRPGGQWRLMDEEADGWCAPMVRQPREEPGSAPSAVVTGWQPSIPGVPLRAVCSVRRASACGPAE